MRIFDKDAINWNKKEIFCCVLVVILAVMCSIVLYITNNFSVYLYNFVKNYIYSVFNFNNAALFFGQFLTNLFYYFLALLFCRFKKVRYLYLIVIFVKTLFTFYYFVALFIIFSLEGVIAAFIVFLPCYIFFMVKFFFLCTQSACIERRYKLFSPVIFVLCDGIFILVLVNLIFRFIVVIV